MTVFVVIAQEGSDLAKLPAALDACFPNAAYKLDENAWLVPFKGSAEDLSDKLGVTTGANGGAVILEVASYFGRANPNIWAWIKANWGA